MAKPYHIYLDLDVLNNNPSAAPPLTFEDTRTQPFLDGTADDYFVSIARFNIQTGGALPVFIPSIQTGQSNVNLTVYNVTLRYNNIQGSAYINHVPQPTRDNVSPPITSQDLTGNYYNVYNYQDWIQMVNTALTAAYNILVTNLIFASTISPPTPLDGFTPQAAGITQVITLKDATGNLYAGLITMISSTDPLTMTTVPTTGIYTTMGSGVGLLNTNGTQTFLNNFKLTTTGGVNSFTFTIQISPPASLISLSSSTNTNAANLILTTALGTTVYTNSSGQTITVTNTVKAAVKGAAALFVDIDIPSMTCTLHADANWFNTATTGSATMYFNTRLFGLFTGFPFQFQGYPGNMNYLIPFQNSGSSNILSVTNSDGTTTNYLQAYQETSSIGLWNPVASIVFTSTSLPIHPTLGSPPIIFSDTSTGLIGKGQTNLTNILSDFEVHLTSTNQYRPDITYVPQGEYRLIDMYTNSNLHKIDLNVYWKDKYGNLRPLLLQPGCAASVKVLFRHKNFNLGYE